MKFLRDRRQVISALMMMLMFSWQFSQPAMAATLYWDADATVLGNTSSSGAGLGGTGTWNTSLPNWWDGGSSDAAVTFTSADTAVFTGLGGTVQLGSPITLGSIIFSQNIAASGFNLMGDGTAGSNTLTLAGAASIAVNVAGTDTISAVIAGSNGLNFSSTPTGTLILTGANTYTGLNTVSSGTLSIFADANLGNSANDITFNGSVAAGLTLNGPVVLGAGRTITLSNTGGVVALLSSTGTSAQIVLGQVTGGGTLAVANAGTTYLLNTTNNYTGILWAQTGTISLSALPDASGNGNIKLGSGTSSGGLQWNVGATGALTLSNRSIELAGTTGGGTIDSSSLVAANSITISNNLLFTTVASGAKTLTLTGFNQGTNTFAGNILNNGSSTTALTKSGMDFWMLTGTGNNYTGALTINQGTLRVINSSGLGGTGTFSFGGASNGQGLDIRSDTAPTGIRSISNNSANNAYIYVDHAATAGNNTTGQTITLGTIAQVNSTASITIVGNHGYGVTMGQNTVAGSTTAGTPTSFGMVNDLGSPGLNGYTVGANELVSIAGFTTSGTANTGGVTQTLSGWGNYTITGTISSPVAAGGLALNITKSGLGILTYTPTTISGWTAGTLTLSGGTTRITSSIAAGGATVTLGGGMTELRNNASTNFGFNVANVSATTTLFIDHALNGSTSSQVATIGTLTLNSAATLNVVGDHGYSLVMGAITQKGGVSTIIGNYLGAPGYTGYTGGTITLGNITTDATAGAATLTLAGFGDYVLGGTISSSNAGVSMNITKSNLGVVTFSGNNSAWTSTSQGVLNTTFGTTRIDASTASIGGSSIGIAGGLTEVRSNTDTAWSANNLILQTASGTLVAAPQIGAAATTLSKTLTLGSLTSVTTALTFSFDTNHNYGITLNGAATTAIAATTINNVGNGVVTFAGGLTNTGATVWTLGGNGDFNVTGNILAGSATNAITKSGQGTLTISGTANTYAGNFIANSGIIRITNATGLGGTVAGTLTFLGNQGAGMGVALDLRNNSSMDLSGRALTRAYNTVFNVDNNGSGTNGTMTLGTGLSMQDNGWSLTATGANGYSLKFGSAAAANVAAPAGGIAFTFYNFIPSVSGSGNVEFAGGLTYVNTASTGQLTLAGTGDYVISGPLTYTTGGTTDTLTKSGAGTLTLSGNSSTTWNNAAAVITMTAGITRVTTGNGLGGASSKVNLNAGTLDLRSDAGITILPTITVGANNSYLNVDAAVGSAGTAGSNTDTLGGVSLGAFTLFATGGGSNAANVYNLNTGTLTMTGAGTIINNIGNAGTLTATSIGGTQTTVFNGSGSTIISGAAVSSLGAITKSGTGTVTFQESAAGANTTGNLTINAGSLVADYGTGVTNTIFTATDTVTFAGGNLQIKGATAGTATAQTLGNLTVNAGGGTITLTPQGGGTTTLTTGTLTATATGGTFLFSVADATKGVLKLNTAMNTATTLSGRAVIFDSVTASGNSNYNWLANGGANTNSIAYASYNDVNGTTLTGNTLNDRISSTTASEVTTGATVATNSLMINARAASQSLSLGSTILTLTNGGLLFTGSNAYSITGTSTGGLKSGIASTSDFIINNYGSAALTISAPIVHNAGTDTLTVGGTGTTIMGNATLAAIGSYTGLTYVNGGTLKLTSGIASLGNTTSTGLTINGGTFDLNGNNLGIGAVTGGYAGTIDNSGGVATLTVGNNNTTVSILGTIKNSGSALSLVKTGTGVLTLGDVNGMSSMAFTGDLTVNAQAAAGANVMNLAVALADTSGTKINLGSATAAETVQITYVGNTNMVLNNRQFDLSGASNVTINGSGVSGQNGTAGVLVINSNLLLDGTGNKTLTLGGTAGNVINGGTVSGITGSGAVNLMNTFAGTIGVNNPNSITLAVAVTGTGGWALTGANTFTGGLTMSSTGILRGTVGNGATSGSFGGSGNLITMSAGTLDLRSDTSQNFGNSITWQTNNIIINVDRAVGGSGYGQIMTLGTITESTTGKTLTVTNLNNNGTSNQNQGYNSVTGYGLRIAGLNLNTTGTTTVNNVMGAPGADTFAVPTVGTGVAGALVIDNVTAAANLGATTLTIGVATTISNGVTIIPGDIIQTAGGATPTVLGVVYAGNGTLILGGTTATNAYAGGLTIGSANAVVRATTGFSLGTGTVMYNSGGTLEVRNDSNVTYTNAVTVAMGTAATAKLNVGEAINGTGGHGNTFAFGQLTFQGITGNALTIGGVGGSNNSSGDLVTFNGVNLNLAGTAGFTVTSNLLLPGGLNLGNVTSAGTSGVQTLTIAGTGGIVTLGDVTNGTGTATTAIVSNLTGGILDLTRMTSASTFTGGLTLSTGTTRVANSAAASTASIGGTGNTVIFNGGQLEVRSDVNVTYTNPMQLLISGAAPVPGSGINIGQLANGSGTNAGITFTFSGGFKSTAAGKSFAINGVGGLATGAASLASNGDSVAFTGGIDLNGTTGGSTTIVNNLPLPGMVSLGNVTSSTSGAATLTVGGSGVSFLGDVTNGSGTVGLTYTGTGILDLSRMTAATNYSGGFTQSGTGITRVTSGVAFGSAGSISLQNGTVEIRSDTNFTYSGALNWNASNNVNINVGELGTGTTTGVGSTFTLGTLTITTASVKTLTFAGIGNTGASSSDSITVNNVTFGAGNLSNVISNNLALPGTLSLGNITGNGTSGTVTLTIGGTGFTTIGDVANGSGGSITALTYSGTGILQITPTASTTTNYSGGLNITGNGTLRVITNGTAANFGAGTITLAGGTGSTGTLDIRTDAALSVANAILVNTNSVILNVDAATSGNLSNTVTFSGTATTISVAKTMTLTSGSNYAMTFTNGFNVSIAGATIANNASGTVNLGAISYSAAAGALTISGSGLTMVGNITGTTAAAALTYSGTGLLDLTGNAGATNPLSAITLSGAGSITRVGSATNLGAANNTVTFSSTTTAATLQVRNDSSVTLGNTVVFNGAATALAIIDVGNNGGSSTGNTVTFGALTNSGSGNSGTLTINGANGYGVSFASLALPNGTANVNTTLVANAPVAITGGVTNANTGTSAVADTLILDGVSTGSIGGAIADSTAALTVVTKQGTGTWTFAGANTYTGATTINNGTLLINGSSAAGSAYTVNGSATQGLQGTLGGTGTIGGSVTLATNGATSFALGAVLNPGTVGAAGTLTINGTLTTNSFTSLNFDLGANATPGGVNDLIITSLLPNLGANTLININTLATLANGSYTLISGYTGTLTLSNLVLGSFTGVDTIHAGALQVSDGLLQLIVTSPTPATAYWSGAINGTWNTFGSGVTTNWRTDASGNVDTNALPGGVTDVHFYTTTPAVAASPVTTILGTSFGIRTLSFDASSINAVSISGNVLTITPTSSSTGITIDAAAGAVTINSSLVLGAAQTWTNNSTSSLFTVTGNVANGGNLLTIAGAGSTTISTGIISGAVGGLTKTGNGTLTLGAANTYGGATTLSGGTLRLLTTTNVLPTATALSLSGTATLTIDGAQTLAGTFSDTATNTLNGSAVLTFNNGSITVNSLIAGSAGFGIGQTGTGTITLANASSTNLGTLNVTAPASSTSTIDIGGNTMAITGITLGGSATTSAPVIAGSSGTLNLSGNVTYTSTNNPLGGLISVTNLNLQGAQRTFTIGDSTTTAADLTISSIISNGSIIKAGAGTLVFTNANTYTGLTTISAGALQLGNGGTTGSLDTTGGILDNGTLTVNRSNTMTQSTGFGNISGTGSVIMNGGGTLVLDGTNTYTGNTTVNASTLNLTGSWTGSASASALKYGEVAGNSIVNISGTYSGFIMTGANIAGSVAVMNQTAGTVTIVPTNGADTQWIAKTGYGYLNITGGNLNTGRFDVNAPGGSAVGVLYVGGTGTLTQNTGDYFIIAYAGLAQMTVGPGGSFIRTSGASANFQITMQNANSSGTLNIAGGTVSTGPAKGITFGFSSPGTGITGFVNLAAGTLAVGANTALVGATGSTSEYFNFAGGTLKANAALTNAIPASNANHTVTSTIFGAINNFAATGDTSQNFTGGLKVDTNTFAVTLSNPLLGATGSGVAQSSLTVTGGSGYIGAPAVQFTGGTLAAGGTPASGYALISGGQVTGIVITNPGTYTVAPTVTLSGGGGTGASVAVGTLVANSSGGLTKIGTGTLTLGGTNTFAGGVDIQGGMISIATLTNGGVNGPLGTSSNDAANLLLGSSVAGGGILQYNGTTAGSTDRNFTLNNVSGGFDASGTTAGTFALTSSSAITVTGGLGNAFLYLQGSGTGTAGAGSIGNLLTDGTGTTVGLIKQGAGTWTVTNTNTYSGVTTLSAGTLVAANVQAFGLNTTAAALTLTSGTLNLATDSSVNAYNTTVGGTVTIVSNTASVTAGITHTLGTLSIGANTLSITQGANATGTTSAVTFGNVTQTGNSVFDVAANVTLTLGGLQSSGQNITKQNSGTLILSGAANAARVAGTTTLTAGTLVLGSASALGTTGATLVLNGGTLDLQSDTSVNAYNTTVGATMTILADKATASSAGITHTLGTLSMNGSTLNVSAGANVSGGTPAVAFGAVTLTGTGTFNATTADLSLASITGTNRAVVLTGTSTGSSAGAITSGSGTLTKSGTGTWRLTGSTTNTGAVAVQGGSLWLAGGNDILNPSGGVVTLGSGAASGVLIIGGNADGTTTAGSQRSQTLNQTTATSILVTSGTGTQNSIVGGADGGTSAGTPANNSTFTLNIGAGFTDTYGGLIGWDGTGSVGFKNNINLVKSGAGTLILSGNLMNWTGTMTNAAEGTDLTVDATRPTITISGGVLRATGVINTVVLQTGGIFDDQTTSHGSNFYLKITGGLVTSNALADNAEDVVETISHGVYAFNFNNTGTTGVSGSDMYLGAVGDRIFSGSVLAAGTGNIYRFGGGAPWNAVASATLGGSGGYLQIATANVVTGANNVIIGDNGTYGGGLGIYGGNSTVEFTAAQNYTGTTTLAGGTLVVSNSTQLGNPTTTAGSIILDGGILRYSGITTDFSNRITIDSGGTIDTGANNVTFATAIGNSDTGTSTGTSHPTTNGVGGLTKTGTGTLTLTAANTYAGTTTVSGGTLKLNRQTGSLTTGSALTFGGNGTFNFDNTGASGALSQTFGTLTFSAGDGVILSTRTAAQSTTLTFAALPTRTAGATGNFTVTGTGSSASVDKVVLASAPATNQFLNAGLYFGGVDFAVYDSTGYIRAINYSTDTNAATSTGGATLGATVTGKDLQLTTAAVTAQTTDSINSLKIAGAFGITIGSGNTLTIAGGALIKTGATATITGGTLATSGELVIRQDASGDALSIASVINSVGLTKSGLGTLTLSTSTNNLGNGQVFINGGSISVDSESRFGTAGTTYSGVTLNGGGLTITGNTTISGTFTLGLAGGTITQSNANQDNNIGVAGDLLFVGSGARTLTLVGADSRAKTFRFNIGDNGGPTSVTIAGGGDSNVIILSGANSYTGTTTITRGILRLTAATQLPGGLGGVTLNTTNTGGGNITFNGLGTGGVNRAILETGTAAGDIYRSVGTGFDQIQWTGSGGFSNQSAGTTRIVNLGGAAATLTWNSGGFVPTGSRLQFGEAAANVGNSAGTIDFQNSINLGTASRTIDVTNGTAIVEAVISGNLIFGSGGGLTLNTGTGTLSLSGTNNAAGAATIDILTGTLYFANANAVLGTSGNITITGGVSSLGLAGSTNPLTSIIGSRIVTSSTGSVALDTNSSATLNFSSYTALRLSAYNPGNTAVYFTGTITPNGTTYRFGGQHFDAGGNAPAYTLVLSNKNTLTGARNLDLAPGIFTLTAAQNYTGGTVVNTTLAGSTSSVGIGSDAAFGPGTITVGGGNTVVFGAVNGDRVVYNRIIDTQTGTVSFVVTGDQASDGTANNTNQGAITYAGTLDLSARAATAVLHVRTSHAAIFLGNITNSTNGLQLNNSTAGLFSFLTAANGGVNKTFSGTTNLADNTTLVIDSDGSLGTSGGLTLGNSTLILQPGTTGTIALAGTSTRTLTVTADKSPNFVVGAGGTIAITGAINGGTNTAARTFTKFGAGTLALRGANGTYTGATGGFANTMQVYGGKLQLDSVNFTAATDRFISESTLMPLTFGVASATLGGGGTLEIVHDASKAFALTQGFGNLTINQGAHTIALTNNNVTQALTLNLGSTFTRTALTGGTLNFTSTTAGGTNTIGSAITNNAGGIIGGYATFNDLDWAVQSGSNTITALASGSYTTLVAASNSATGNFILSTGSVTLSTSNASLNTLKLVGSAGGTNLTLNGTNVLTSGGVIFDNTLGSASISGGTQLGTTGTEIIVFTGGSGSTSTNKLTLTAVIKGAATALTKSGSGTLVLAGANTYSGSLIINAGTVEYSNGSATGQNLGSPTAGATNIILNGGVLRQTATNNLIFGITVNGPAAIDLASGVTLTQSAQGITGIASGTGLNTGLLQKTGLGTLTLAGSTADSNLSIEIVGGVLNLGKTSVLAVGEATNTNGVPYAALIVDNGAVANLTGTGGNQIGDASSVVVKSGGVFDVMGTGATVTTESFDGLAGTGTVRNTVGTLFTLTLGSNNSSSLSPYTLGAAAAGVGSTGLNNFGGVIQGNIALNKIGSGTQILSGNNTYSGSTTINEGTLKLGTTNALPSGAGKGDVTLIGDSTATGIAIGGSATVLAPGTLDLGGYNQAINGLNSTTGGFVVNNPTAGANITNTLTVGNGDANGAFNGVITDGYSVGADSTTATPLAYVGTINFTKTGAGTQALSGANTASGVLTVNQGEVDLNTTGANAWSGNVAVNTTGTVKLLQSNQILDSKTLAVAGGTFQLNGSAETVAGVSLTGGGFILDTAGGGALTSTTTYDLQSGTVSGILAGSVGVSKTTSGTVILSGANTFTGKTSVTGGVLSISADNNLGVAPGSYVADQLTLDGGTLQSTATLVIASTRGITVGTGGGTFDTASGTTETINSVILGGGPITKIGAGTLVFTAANTYTGKTSIQQGALSVVSINSVATPAQSASSSLGNPSNAANGTIDMGATTTTGALVYTGTGETTDRVVNLAGTTGGGALDQSGTGALKFTSDLTATGAGSKVLTLQGSTAGTGEISGAIVDNGGANTTGVTKAGTGTWILSGTNTYTGATTVNGGTLQVGSGGAGSIGNSAVTVNNTGTLSGSGTIAGSTVIGNGGVLAPGDGDPSTSNTTLTFGAATNSLTVADAGSIHLSLTTADSTDTGFADWFHAHPGGTAADYVASIGGIANTGSGTSWNDTHSGSHDFISAADTIILGSTSTLDHRVVVSLNNISGVNYGSIFNVMDWSTLGLTHDDSALSAMGAFNTASNLQLQDLASLSTGLAWDTSLFDSYGILVVVPEPNRALLLMFGLLGLLARRRRRRAVG